MIIDTFYVYNKLGLYASDQFSRKANHRMHSYSELHPSKPSWHASKNWIDSTWKLGQNHIYLALDMLKVHEILISEIKSLDVS